MDVDRETILTYLREQAERPVKPKELAQALKVKPREVRAFEKLLEELEEAGAVVRVREGRYGVPERLNLVVGRLQITRGGHGFVVPEVGRGDVHIAPERLGNAYDGDRVVARIERRVRRKNPEGSIVRVLERARSQVVGLYHRSGRYGFLVPDVGTFHRDVFIPPGGEGGARDGMVAVARIVDWGSEHHSPVGEITKVLGRPGEPGVDVLSIVHAHELRSDFPPDVTAEARKLARLRGRLDISGRTDFRKLLTFTIDPSDAKDHDDAISVERVGDGRWRVGVHIADVSHFVQTGSAIDREALERSTSVYLVDRVVPMLPEVLSGDLCSLKPGEDRLTLSVMLDVDEGGRVHSSRFVAGVIRSRYALSYEHAQEILDGKSRARDDLRKALRTLRDLAARLRERRQARGGLDFDLPEARVIVNAAGEPMRIERLLRLETHRLIEELMILANETVARLAKSKGIPFIYRVHEHPDPDRLEKLREFVGGLGLKLPRSAHRSPRALQKLLEQVDGRPEEAVVSTLVLRSMQQARYSVEASEHFGLALRNYTHFTSPIRRYPDLAIHRLVRAAFLEGARIPGSARERLEETAVRASVQERRAMEAERESVELKKMEYMERHLGDVFEGVVSGVTSFGLFVLLDDVVVEGLVHVSRLEDDYYRFVEDEYALVGEVRGRRFRLGDRVKAKVVSVDREARQLDLAPVDVDVD
jgi:ribonuclease R